MFSTAVDSTKLFLTGKLFKDYKMVFKQLAIGIGSGALVLVLVGLVAPIWVAAMAGGLVAGFLQPILFKDLKYA